MTDPHDGPKDDIAFDSDLDIECERGSPASMNTSFYESESEDEMIDEADDGMVDEVHHNEDSDGSFKESPSSEASSSPSHSRASYRSPEKLKLTPKQHKVIVTRRWLTEEHVRLLKSRKILPAAEEEEESSNESASASDSDTDNDKDRDDVNQNLDLHVSSPKSSRVEDGFTVTSTDTDKSSVAEISDSEDEPSKSEVRAEVEDSGTPASVPSICSVVENVVSESTLAADNLLLKATDETGTLTAPDKEVVPSDNITKGTTEHTSPSKYIVRNSAYKINSEALRMVRRNIQNSLKSIKSRSKCNQNLRTGLKSRNGLFFRHYLCGKKLHLVYHCSYSQFIKPQRGKYENTLLKSRMRRSISFSSSRNKIKKKRFNMIEKDFSDNSKDCSERGINCSEKVIDCSEKIIDCSENVIDDQNVAVSKTKEDITADVKALEVSNSALADTIVPEPVDEESSNSNNDEPGSGKVDIVPVQSKNEETANVEPEACETLLSKLGSAGDSSGSIDQSTHDFRHSKINEDENSDCYIVETDIRSENEPSDDQTTDITVKDTQQAVSKDDDNNNAQDCVPETGSMSISLSSNASGKTEVMVYPVSSEPEKDTSPSVDALQSIMKKLGVSDDGYVDDNAVAPSRKRRRLRPPGISLQLSIISERAELEYRFSGEGSRHHSDIEVHDPTMDRADRSIQKIGAMQSSNKHSAVSQINQPEVVSQTDQHKKVSQHDQHKHVSQTNQPKVVSQNDWPNIISLSTDRPKKVPQNDQHKHVSQTNQPKVDSRADNYQPKIDHAYCGYSIELDTDEAVMVETKLSERRYNPLKSGVVNRCRCDHLGVGMILTVSQIKNKAWPYRIESILLSLLGCEISPTCRSCNAAFVIDRKDGRRAAVLPANQLYDKCEKALTDGCFLFSWVVSHHSLTWVHTVPLLKTEVLEELKGSDSLYPCWGQCGLVSCTFTSASVANIRRHVKDICAAAIKYTNLSMQACKARGYETGTLVTQYYKVMPAFKSLCRDEMSVQESAWSDGNNSTNLLNSTKLHVNSEGPKRPSKDPKFDLFDYRVLQLVQLLNTNDTDLLIDLLTCCFYNALSCERCWNKVGLDEFLPHAWKKMRPRHYQYCQRPRQPTVNQSTSTTDLPEYIQSFSKSSNDNDQVYSDQVQKEVQPRINGKFATSQLRQTRQARRERPPKRKFRSGKRVSMLFEDMSSSVKRCRSASFEDELQSFSYSASLETSNVVNNAGKSWTSEKETNSSEMCELNDTPACSSNEGMLVSGIDLHLSPRTNKENLSSLNNREGKSKRKKVNIGSQVRTRRKLRPRVNVVTARRRRPYRRRAIRKLSPQTSKPIVPSPQTSKPIIPSPQTRSKTSSETSVPTRGPAEEAVSNSATFAPVTRSMTNIFLETVVANRLPISKTAATSASKPSVETVSSADSDKSQTVPTVKRITRSAGAPQSLLSPTRHASLRQSRAISSSADASQSLGYSIVNTLIPDTADTAKPPDTSTAKPPGTSTAKPPDTSTAKPQTRSANASQSLAGTLPTNSTAGSVDKPRTRSGNTSQSVANNSTISTLSASTANPAATSVGKPPATSTAKSQATSTTKLQAVSTAHHPPSTARSHTPGPFVRPTMTKFIPVAPSTLIPISTLKIAIPINSKNQNSSIFPFLQSLKPLIFRPVPILNRNDLIVVGRTTPSSSSQGGVDANRETTGQRSLETSSAKPMNTNAQSTTDFVPTTNATPATPPPPPPTPPPPNFVKCSTLSDLQRVLSAPHFLEPPAPSSTQITQPAPLPKTQILPTTSQQNESPVAGRQESNNNPDDIPTPAHSDKLTSPLAPQVPLAPEVPLAPAVNAVEPLDSVQHDKEEMSETQLGEVETEVSSGNDKLQKKDTEFGEEAAVDTDQNLPLLDILTNQTKNNIVPESSEEEWTPANKIKQYSPQSDFKRTLRKRHSMNIAKEINELSLNQEQLHLLHKRYQKANSLMSAPKENNTSESPPRKRMKPVPLTLNLKKALTLNPKKPVPQEESEADAPWTDTVRVKLRSATVFIKRSELHGGYTNILLKIAEAFLIVPDEIRCVTNRTQTVSRRLTASPEDGAMFANTLQSDDVLEVQLRRPTEASDQSRTTAEEDMRQVQRVLLVLVKFPVTTPEEEGTPLQKVVWVVNASSVGGGYMTYVLSDGTMGSMRDSHKTYIKRGDDYSSVSYLGETSEPNDGSILDQFAGLAHLVPVRRDEAAGLTYLRYWYRAEVYTCFLLNTATLQVDFTLSQTSVILNPKKDYVCHIRNTEVVDEGSLSFTVLSSELSDKLAYIANVALPTVLEDVSY